ncbi:MAG TPA: hypothetical protein VHU40_12155, partial [Polyangia bacterium]|nr:hypothetical protein [Polyangia bacterium]
MRGRFRFLMPCLLLPACAAALGNGPASRDQQAAEPVWAALVAGDDDQVAARLARAPREADGERPRDLASWLADASLAFERGVGPRAIDSYLAVLEGADAVGTTDASVMAAMATGRLGTLLDEHPGPET